jgi:hypothetical protein
LARIPSVLLPNIGELGKRIEELQKTLNSRQKKWDAAGLPGIEQVYGPNIYENRDTVSAEHGSEEWTAREKEVLAKR